MHRMTPGDNVRTWIADRDRQVARAMTRFGHPLHRWSIGVLFIWLGLLKVVGFETGSSLIARVVYGLPADVAVPLLGGWEIAIGAALIVPGLVRVAVLLMALRLPGTLLALALHLDVSFESVPFAPTPTGQFLIKDFMLFSAAMVIGGAEGRKQGDSGGNDRPADGHAAS